MSNYTVANAIGVAFKALNYLTTHKNIMKKNIALVPNSLDSDGHCPYNLCVIEGTRASAAGGTIRTADLWIMVNAYYDYDRQRFCRYNVNDFSFGWQLQGGGTYPGEEAIGDTSNQGVNLWKANGKNAYSKTDPMYTETGTDIGEEATLSDGTTYWREYGIMLGWSNTFMCDSYGGMTIGGAGFEIDGSGVNPFRRVTSTKFSSGTSNGLDVQDYMKMFQGDLWNAQHGMWNKDQDTQNGYFWGMESPVRYMENGSFNEYSDTANLQTDTDSFVVLMNEANQKMTIENWKYMLKVTMLGRGYINNKAIVQPNETVDLKSTTKTQSWSLNYPTGMNKNNCFVLCSFITDDDGTVKQASTNYYTFTDYGINIWAQEEVVEVKVVLSYIDSDSNLGNSSTN